MHSNILRSIFEYNMGFLPGESIMVVTDDESYDLGKKFYRVAKKLTKDAVLISMPVRERSGSEPPVAISEAMKNSDILMLVTTKSLSHTTARRNASKNGVRTASMPGLKEYMIKGSLSADYSEIRQLNTLISQRLSSASVVRVLTDAGTDLLLDVKGRWVDPDGGTLTKSGAFGNLPAGEVSLSPTEGSANGTLVIDGSVPGIPLSEPIRVAIVDGVAVVFEGKESSYLEKKLSDVNNPIAFSVAELGIGTNKSAKIKGNVLEDEKVFGTIHIAFGNNCSYGGTQDVPIHLDCVVRSPTLYFDGEMIMEKGRMLI